MPSRCVVLLTVTSKQLRTGGVSPDWGVPGTEVLVTRNDAVADSAGDGPRAWIHSVPPGKSPATSLPGSFSATDQFPC